ncbi:Hypothetical predicted protein [Paramuricea clavata]|uniref:Uncharacterized protein n=1 Tax=Paramuricea clavata TaxID=317549 RepID=A0A6S7HHM2_PARCT|nr:Hypothetical predicted protein [Paramuricea clavata]
MTLGSGGWTVIQRRQDGSEEFDRSWTDYKNGFGNMSGELWLGLDKIHRLTNSGQNVLRINMTTKNNDQFYAEYENFFVSDESEQYKLDVDNYSGNTDYDSMAYHNGYKFYTKDKDNDDKCADTKKGGW